MATKKSTSRRAVAVLPFDRRIEPDLAKSLEDTRDDLCRQVSEAESLLACVRAWLESVPQCPGLHMSAPADLRIARNQLAELGDCTVLMMMSMQRLASIPTTAFEAAEA